jgi:hypothetical protein
MNLRDKFFAIQLKRKTIDVPGVGVVMVREMSTAEVSEIASRHNVSATGGALASVPETVILCTLDPETEKPIWTPADRDAVKKLPPRILLPISKAISELSKQDEASIGEAEKNSPADAASSSNSPGSSASPSAS